jgi:hypothetical protein
VAIFVVAALAWYHWRPTFGMLVLTGGWIALVTTGWMLAKAVTSFDLRVGDTAHTAAGGMSEGRRVELEREKKLLVKAIKEIEFDQGMGKVEDEEARGTIARYRARAVEILRLLDQDKPAADDAEIESLIEAEVARRLARAPRACGKCQLPNDADAIFCKKCGTKLTAA